MAETPSPVPRLSLHPEQRASGVLTVEELAERLRIGVRSAYLAVERGDVPSIRIGRLIRIPEAAVDRLLAADDQ